MDLCVPHELNNFSIAILSTFPPSSRSFLKYRRICRISVRILGLWQAPFLVHSFLSQEVGTNYDQIAVNIAEIQYFTSAQNTLKWIII